MPLSDPGFNTGESVELLFAQQMCAFVLSEAFDSIETIDLFDFIGCKLNIDCFEVVSNMFLACCPGNGHNIVFREKPREANLRWTGVVLFSNIPYLRYIKDLPLCKGRASDMIVVMFLCMCDEVVLRQKRVSLGLVCEQWRAEAFTCLVDQVDRKIGNANVFNETPIDELVESGRCFGRVKSLDGLGKVQQINIKEVHSMETLN